MYRLADINALALLVAAVVLAGYCGRVALALVSGLMRNTGTWTGRGSAPCPSRPSAGMRMAAVMALRAFGWASVVLLLLALPGQALAAPYGTVVTNNATVIFDVPSDGKLGLSVSGSVSFSVDRHSTLEVLQVSTDTAAQTYEINSGAYDVDGTGVTYNPNPATAPRYAGSATPVDISVPVALETLSQLDMGDPIFLVVTDAAENTDPLGVEFVTVTVTAGSAGESEIIQLMETGPDTGVFSAFVQTVDANLTPVSANDGYVSLSDGDSVSISYTDADSTTSASAITAQTPYGGLSVTKAAIGNKVAQGGSVDYMVSVNETMGYTVTGVEVIDTLPVDFTFVPGSAMINSASAPTYVPLADPAIGAGNVLTFNVGDMAGSEQVNITYTVQVDPAATLGAVSDSVYATGSSGAVVSSTTSSTLSVELPAQMELLRLSNDPAARTYYINQGAYDVDGTGTSFSPIPASAPKYADSTKYVDITAPVPLEPLTVLHMEDPIFIVVTDDVRNTDPLTVEYITVTITAGTSGESEVIRLVETDPDTGVFTAFVETVDASVIPASANDGYISLGAGDTISVTYTDADGLGSASQLLADPVSIVFDSSSGTPVDGLTVTLIDNSTGLPATVYGDDGTSVFPSIIQSGGSLTSGGKTYTFPSGGYRFPYIPAGDYRLEVTGTGYTFPTVVSDAVLQTLPGAPYALSAASRGNVFSVNTDHVIEVSLPVDSLLGSMLLTKTAGKASAAVGDYVQYALRVEETAGYNAINVQVLDTLPRGFVYKSGSAMINGVSAADPSISADHRTLTFSLGDMMASTSAEIKYVVEVAAGASTGDAVNVAEATVIGTVRSNTATATVRVYEDLFRSTATVMGSVIADNCGEATQDSDLLVGGLGGVRIYMEDGSFVVTDDKGRFHFKDVKPGAHVLQLDYDSLPPQYEPALCEDSTEAAGSKFSRFVDIRGGTLWRADFHLALKPHALGEISATFDSKALEGGRIEYRTTLEVGDVPIDNVRATVILPEGAEYMHGTASHSGVPAEEPVDIAGSLTFRLGVMSNSTSHELVFEAVAPLEGDRGEYEARALITFDAVGGKNMRSPVMNNVLVRDYEEDVRTSTFVVSTLFEPSNDILTEADKVELDGIIKEMTERNIDHIFTFGHTDSLPLSSRARQKFRNNYDLSLKRAKSVAEYVGNALGLDEKSISYVGHGPDKPVADNATAEGRARNRRVEIKAFYKKVERNYLLETRQGTDASAEMEAIGARGGASYTEGYEYTVEPDPEAPLFDEAWMRGMEPGLGWVWPEDGVLPRFPSLTMAIKHRPGSHLEMTLDGKPVSAIYMETTKVDESRTRAVTLYKGIPIGDGDNHLVVREIYEGAETGSFTRNVHYSTDPVKAELLPGRSRLVADGITAPVIVVRLTDEGGYPVRKGTMGEFTVNSPYKALEKEIGTLDALVEGRTRYRVGDDGVAYIMLAPTVLAGEASVVVHMQNGDEKIDSWLKSEPRDWIVVGFAEGTIAHSTLSGNMEALDESGYEPDLYNEGRVAFFAKGRVKGKWLLTAAYDSARKPYDERKLFDKVDPDRYYVLYGDSTEQGNEAMSSRKLFLKLESEKFYALFGDYDTGLTVTHLSRYSRRLNGIKSEYRGDTFRYRVFASDTNQAFIKDELPSDGTSGLYRLTRSNIVMNSETVHIVTRNRTTPDVVVSEHLMSRHIDYNIDYRDGTIYFHSPVSSTDENFNPVSIVVDYESYDDSDTSINYGGRAAVSLSGDRAEVGATVVHEATVGREGDLTGMDTTVKITDKVELKAEYASTTNDDGTAKTDGSAYRLELMGKGSRLSAMAYALEQEAGFGLGQQSSADSGVKRTGVEASYKAARRFDVGTRLYTQSNTTTGIDRDYAELNGNYGIGNITFTGAFRSNTDSMADGTEAESRQLVTGIGYRLGRLMLRASREQALSGKDESVDFPTRTKLGAEYMLADDSSVFVEHEMSESDAYETTMTRGGIKTSPWKDARMNTSLERQFSESGTRVLTNFGLVQDWRINDNWAMSAGLDSRQTIINSPAPAYIANSPVANTEDFTAMSLGTSYQREGFAFRALVEQKDAETHDKLGLSTSVLGEPREGLGLSVGLRMFRTEYDSGAESSDLDLRFGLVRRPLEARWIVLDRLDYIAEKETGGLLEYDSWRVVNNLNANFRPGTRVQTSLQYGTKYVKESIDANDYKGYTDLMGFEVRYNIDSRWDVGASMSRLSSHDAGVTDTQTGISVGYVAARNMWLSVGYNYDGYTDRDFSAADYTASGMYLKLRMKFDQISMKDALRYFSGL